MCFYHTGYSLGKPGGISLLSQMYRGITVNTVSFEDLIPPLVMLSLQRTKEMSFKALITLFAFHVSGCSVPLPDEGGDASRRTAIKYQPERKTETLAFGDKTHHGNAVSSHFEKLRLCPYPVKSQGCCKTAAKLSLQFIRRRYILHLASQFWGRQPLPVNLAVGRERDFIQLDKGSWHHVVWQFLCKKLPQLIMIDYKIFIMNVVQAQHPVIIDRGHCLTDAIILQALAFYLAHFYAKPPQFHLRVNTSEILKFPLFIPAAEVT